jgi:hypothetical protein
LFQEQRFDAVADLRPGEASGTLGAGVAEALRERAVE